MALGTPADQQRMEDDAREASEAFERFAASKWYDYAPGDPMRLAFLEGWAAARGRVWRKDLP